MKKLITALMPLLGFAWVSPTAFAAADNSKTAPMPEKKTMRVLAGPGQETRMFTKHLDRSEKETVTFLGVETSPASDTLAAQLGLPGGCGLVVNSVVPDSPAAGALRQHDVLLKFEDQILIEQRQLAVLIRNRKEGEEVTLTFLRAGKQTTAKVKLATHEVPKFSGVFTMPLPGPGEMNFAFGPSAGRFEMPAPPPDGPKNEEEMDHLLQLIQRGPGAPDTPSGVFMPPATRIFIDRQHGPGFRAMTVNPGNSNLVFSDDEGSLELTIKDGKKTLVAKDAKGGQLFSGPVTTPEERAAMPEEIRVRLEQLEGMRDVTFKTDDEFRGAETKMIRPLGRGVSLPLPMRGPIPTRQPLL